MLRGYVRKNQEKHSRPPKSCPNISADNNRCFPVKTFFVSSNKNWHCVMTDTFANAFTTIAKSHVKLLHFSCLGFQLGNGRYSLQI